ncbi:unnamed protein product [Linum trigynum]|uniref:F-box domain-containing protein n=1 Tax=Linum trigynum TaxID=586398 RepID=A0AAV2FY51_9ROSI
MESDYFPSDIVVDILSRLPVETLFRFKSVSTNWDAMITPTNHYLVSMHLKNYTNNPATKASLLATYLDDYDYESYPFPSAQNPFRSISLCPDDDDRPPIHVGQSLLERIVCGTGNGLFLLDTSYHHHYSLWNPATREIRPLPDPPFASEFASRPQTHQKHSSDYCGVGVDLVANDIKVVLIRNNACCACDALGYRIPSSSRFPLPVFVYTSRSNCWSEVAGGYHPYEDGVLLESEEDDLFSCHTYSDGFFYWLFKDYYGNVEGQVVAFDMGNNLFHKINCPVDDPQPCHIGLFRGSVALFDGQLDYSRCDIWLLSRNNNTGGQSSWIKHLTLGVFPEELIVYGCWKDDQFIAQTRWNDQLLLYYTGSKQIKVLASKSWSATRLNIYKQSLLSTLPVSLTNGKGLQEE